MSKKRNKAHGSSGRPKKSPQAVQSQTDPTTIGRVITVKDAGWVTPSMFVAPLTFVPIDPPRPLNRRRPKGE